jgi:hypothetical protein
MKFVVAEPNLSYRLLRMIYPAFRVLFPTQNDSGWRLGTRHCGGRHPENTED